MALKLQRALDDCDRGQSGSGTLALADLLGDVEPFADVADYRQAIRSNLAIWNRTNPTLVQMLSNPARVAAISGDGQNLVAVTSVKTVGRWELPSGRIDGEPWTMPESIDAILVSTDGQRIVAYAGGRIHWREWPPLTQARSLMSEKGEPAEMPLALYPNGKMLFALRNGKPHLFDTTVGPLQIVPFHSEFTTTAAAWNPAGDSLLFGMANGKASISVRTDQGWKDGAAFKHRAAISAVAWTARGKVAVVATADGMIALWNAANGELIAAFPAHPPGPMTLSANDGFLITSGVDRQVKIWRSDSGAMITALPHPAGVKAAAWSNVRTFMTLDEMGDARVWELPDGLVRQSFGGGKERLSRPVLSSDGKSVFAMMGDDLPRIVRWPIGESGFAQFSLKELTQFESVRPLAVGPGGVAVVATQTAKGKETWLIAIDAKQVRALFRLAQPGEAKGALFRQDGPELLTWSDGIAHLWNAETGKRIGKPMPFPGVPAVFAVRRDGKAVAIAGDGKDKPGLAQFWSLEEKSDHLRLPLDHSSPLVEVSFEPNGKAIRCRDSLRSILCWDAASGRPLEIAPLPEQSRPIAFSPTGDRHAIRDSSGRLRLYVGGERGFVAMTVPPATEWRSARFSDDGQLLVTGWSDGVRLWDARTGVAIGPLFPFSDLSDAAIVSETRIMAWNDTEACLWQLPSLPVEKSDQWRQRFSINTGLERGRDGIIRLLDAKTWLEDRSELETRNATIKGNP